MAFFQPEFLKFINDLKENNNRDWFEANKPIYLEYVKQPFEVFIRELIFRLNAIEGNILIEPKEAIFRIYRDVRFSKDKSPYKPQMSAVVSPKGRKDKNYPGLYIEITPERVGIYGGIYMPDKELTQNVRAYLADHLEQVKKLLNEPDFQDSYGGIRGEALKRIPKDLQEVHDELPIIANKQWYYFSPLPTESVLEDNFMDMVLEKYNISRPMMLMFKEAAGIEN